MQIQFSEEAWEQYLYWQTQDKRFLKRINDLLEDIGRGGYQGMGKPEPLKNDLSGYWSRRIDERNRLVYRILSGDTCDVIQCRGHYDDCRAQRTRQRHGDSLSLSENSAVPPVPVGFISPLFFYLFLYHSM
jgi:toxin YoeB